MRLKKCSWVLKCIEFDKWMLTSLISIVLIFYINRQILMMKPSKIILEIFLALIIAGQVHLHSVNINPKRATGIVGGEVKINCEVEFGPNHEMSWDFNKLFVYISTSRGEQYPLGTRKYSVHRTGMNFALKVKDLSLEDGGEYMCTSFTSEATAILVVLDSPSIILNPPAPKEGETAMVTCAAKFGGPQKALILPDHYPSLKMYLNDSSPNEMVTANDTSDVKKYYLISMTKNLTVHAEMNKRYITCEIGTAEPFINTSDVAALNVLYSVRDIHRTPNQERYKVGDNISCIADSNPAAFYEWKKVQGGKTMYGNQLKITDEMNGENNWECVARNLINGRWFEEILQANFVVVDPSKSGNERSPVVIPVVVVIIIILVIIAAAAFFFWKKMKKSNGSQTDGNINELQTMESAEAECLPVEESKDSKLGPWECIGLLKSVKDKQELDERGKKILRVLQEDESILEKDPDILIWLIQKASDLIDSEYYEKIVKVAPHGGEDSPLKYLIQLMCDEESFKKLFKDQKKLMSVIQIISSYGDVQYRTQCLHYIILGLSFSGKFSSSVNRYTFEWSEEYLSTLKELLENGADPTRIHPGHLKKERKDRSTAQTAFFYYIFVNLWEKNDLHESLLQVLLLMLSWKCKDNELLDGTLLHRFVEPRWDYIATNRESMPRDFFHQFQNILTEILRQDGTLLVQKDWRGMTPLQSFLFKIKLEERIFGEVREIIQMLQTQEVLSSQDENGWTALHYLAIYFPVIRGEVTQSGRESFLDLVKSFANESNVGCQDKLNGLTALHHHLAWKFPGGISEESREISEESREVYQDFVKHLATYDILEIKDKYGNTALHFLADGFTFRIEDWKMETFVEVLKCLADPRTICIRNKDGETALDIISRRWGKKVPEHYKDKFQELSDILSENN